MNIHSPHVQDFCHVGILLCFYHSWSSYESNTSTARLLPNTQTSKSFSLSLMSKGCMRARVFFFFPSSAPPSMNSLFPFLSCTPPTICNWTLECRHANQVLIHLKLTGRPDYGGGSRLQTPYRHHLYGNTCRDMKELPGSISQSIVCRLCQQTEGKLSHTHLNPTV